MRKVIHASVFLTKCCVQARNFIENYIDMTTFLFQLVNRNVLTSLTNPIVYKGYTQDVFPILRWVLKLPIVIPASVSFGTKQIQLREKQCSIKAKVHPPWEHMLLEEYAWKGDFCECNANRAKVLKLQVKQPIL